MKIEQLRSAEWAFAGWCVVLIAAAILAIVPGWPAVCGWLSKAEAPAWVQAIGSIGAIFGAAWIAGYQERSRARDARKAAVKRARNFAGTVQGTIEDVINRGSLYAVHMVMRRVVLEEAVLDARSINSEVLRLEWIVAVQGLRAIALNVCELMRGFEQGPNYAKTGVRYPDAMNALLKDLAMLKVEVDKHVAVVAQAHPGVDAYED
jgi:hypothetical protein